MKKWNLILRWALLLWKRLYKKPTFLVLLLMIPALVLAYGLTSREDSGLLTVALASESGTPDQLTQTVFAELEESDVILYIRCDTPDEARSLVKAGEADTAWIFADDLEAKIYRFAAFRSRKNAFVTVLEPENRVALKLLREMLSGTLFPHCSEALYLTYVREEVPELAHLTDAQLLEYYHAMEFSDQLFLFTDLEGNLTEENNTDYLLSPVRGMLAVVIVLAGLATALYYIRDTENGTFAWVPENRRFYVELGCQMISLINVAMVVQVALALTAPTASLPREILMTLLYCLCVAAFSMLLRRVTFGIRGLGTATPLLVVAMLVICPVFFDLGALRQAQFLLPPTYYIHGAYHSKYLLLLPVYSLAALALCRLWDRVRRV
jgi:ABC-2 type transport system permease protein